jgi:hypothetical protein
MVEWARMAADLNETLAVLVPVVGPMVEGEAKVSAETGTTKDQDINDRYLSVRREYKRRRAWRGMH